MNYFIAAENLAQDARLKLSLAGRLFLRVLQLNHDGVSVVFGSIDLGVGFTSCNRVLDVTY